MSIIDIRKAYETDTQAVLDIYNDSNTVFGIPAQSIEAEFKTMIKNECCMVLYDDNSAIGFIAYTEKETHAVLSALYIKKYQQRHGWGQKLLQYAEQCICAQGKIAIFLKALKPKPFNWTAAFYQKNGYTPLTEPPSDCPLWLVQYFPLQPWDVGFLKQLAAYS